MIVSPDGKVLLAACAGYNNTGLAVIDWRRRRSCSSSRCREVCNGLAFSPDGKRVFLSGGDSGKIHVFAYETAS